MSRTKRGEAHFRTCNLCKERMYGETADYIKHGEEHHPDYYLGGTNSPKFVEKKLWCPLDQKWYSNLKWLSRTITEHGWTNEQYYLAHGQEYLPEIWNRNTSDPVLNDGRNHDKCIHCGTTVVFHERQWEYPAFCGFPCSTSWFAVNTDRVQRAQDTMKALAADDPNFRLRPNQLMYWLQRGLSEEEAKKKVSERQATNSLEKFIQRADGDVIIGTQNHADRQEKWLNSMAASGMYTGVSAISEEMFSRIAVIVPSISYGKGEIVVRLAERSCKVDCIDRKSKRVIEFYGDFWHGNPDKFQSDHRLGRGIPAAEKWERDSKRIQDLADAGYQSLVIWEKEYRANPDDVVKRCVDFLS